MSSQSDNRSEVSSFSSSKSKTSSSKSATSSSESGTSSSTTTQPAILTFAIEDVLKVVDEQASLSEITKKVIKRLIYILDMKKKLDDSKMFVKSIESKVEKIKETFGGRSGSAIHQVLTGYKTFIREEIKAYMKKEDTNSESESVDEVSGEEDNLDDWASMKQ
jgi:hypothetical protein